MSAVTELRGSDHCREADGGGQRGHMRHSLLRLQRAKRQIHLPQMLLQVLWGTMLQKSWPQVHGGVLQARAPTVLS